MIKPQISGIVSEVYKQAGEPVRQGEVIAKVKVIPDMATLNAAESRVNVARINLAQTKQEFERVKGLFDSGVVAKEEFEKNETEYSKAKEELQNAQDNLEIVQNGIAKRNAELSNTQIRSTITEWFWTSRSRSVTRSFCPTTSTTVRPSRRSPT